MHLNAVPAILRERPQWVVWRSVMSGDGKSTKPPFQARNPSQFADVQRPDTWATFEEAVAAMHNDPANIHGVGFVFTKQDEFFGIDIDDENKVKPEHLETRRSVVKDLLGRVDTYCEISPSGQGLHIIGIGRMDSAGRRSTALQFEIYAAERYFTITGNVFNGHTEIKDQQHLLDIFSQQLANQSKQTEALVDLEVGRSLTLSDEEVIIRAIASHPQFAARFNGQIDCEPGTWSETFMMVVGVLDQITGKVSQVQRLIMNSPMVQQAPPSRAGEARTAKALRNFEHVLGRVRSNNTPFMSAVAHGRQIMEQINAKREAEAKKNAEAILKQSEEGFSKHGVELLKAFPLDPRYLTITPPPGLTGQFAEATVRAMNNPYLKFAIPATLATLAGILGRSYKLPDRSGLNVNFILAAPSATGKTQTMKAWQGFATRAAGALGNTLSGPARNRIVNVSASSIQGIFEDFMEMPSCVWYLPECAGQLQKMSDPKSATDAQLRDAYNELYDVSRVGWKFSPPRSVSNRKANLEPVENLAVSTYWTTTNSKFDVFTDDAQDGFLSRVTIIRHAGAAGDIVPAWQLQPDLEDHLHTRLVDMLSAAKTFDENVLLEPGSAARYVVVVSTDQVEGQLWAFQQIAERIKNASLSEELPIGYTAVSRLPITALRIAGVLAVVDNPYSPSVTVEQFEWAFGYLLQNVASLLSDMDTGVLGATMANDVEVVIRTMKRIMRKNKQHGVKHGELFDALKRLRPFVNSVTSPGETARRTLVEMIESGRLVKGEINDGERGRPFAFYTPTDDPVWK